MEERSMDHKKIPIKRVFPGFHELASLIRFRKLVLSPKRRRLSRALTIQDLRTVAKRLTPQGPFDYTDGAADCESSLTRARVAFEQIEFQPRVLRNVAQVDLSVEMFGKRVSMPMGIAPTGFSRMMQTEGEIAGCTAAAAAGIPFCLSTMGTRSIEDVVTAAPNGRNFFQLYMWKDRDRSMDLVRRAQAAGVDTSAVVVGEHNSQCDPPTWLVVQLVDDRTSQIRITRGVEGDCRRVARSHVRSNSWV
jgi:L-lactate dehydrogenase (cytochrome)